MRKVLLSLMIGLVLALLGCVPPEAPVPITTTRPAVILVTETPPLAPPVTFTLPPASPTLTLSPATDVPLVTPVSEPDMAAEAVEEFRATKIPTPTAIPLPTVPFEPFTQGSVLFLWNEALPPAPDGPSEFEPTVNLYLAQPGATPEEWQVQPVLSNIRAIAPAYLSPDQTKLALLIYDPELSGTCLCDFYKIQVYNLIDGSLVQIENAKDLGSLSWLADSQSIVFPQEKDVFISRLDGSSPQPVTNNSDPSSNWFDGNIGQLAGSPDGRFQALNIYPDSLTILDMESQEMFRITDGLGSGYLDLDWSPDSQWLAFAPDFNLSLFVVSTNTFEVIKLSTDSTPQYYFPAWSPASQQLAFSSLGMLFLWDRESKTTSDLARADYISEPSWSPAGSHIAAGFIEGERMGVMVVDSTNGSRVDFILETFTNLVIWSPDGQWLLFELVQSDKSGLYVMNVEEGVPYLILDTSGKLHVPDYITWLSDTHALP